MITKIYRVKGTFVMGDSYHKFTKEYKATNVADLEEKIYELQERKANLAKTMLSTETTFLNKLSKEDIMALFQ